MAFKTRTFSRSSSFRGGSGGSIGTIIVVLVLVLIGGVVAFLATSDLPPPSEEVEKVIPDQRFR